MSRDRVGDNRTFSITIRNETFLSEFDCRTEAEDARYFEWEASDVKIQNTTRLCHFTLCGCEFTPRREKSTRKWDKVSRDQVGDNHVFKLSNKIISFIGKVNPLVVMSCDRSPFLFLKTSKLASHWITFFLKLTSSQHPNTIYTHTRGLRRILTLLNFFLTECRQSVFWVFSRSKARHSRGCTSQRPQGSILDPHLVRWCDGGTGSG